MQISGQLQAAPILLAEILLFNRAARSFVQRKNMRVCL
jgi:hypothetical protein